MELKKTLYSLMLGGILLCLFSCAKEDEFEMPTLVLSENNITFDKGVSERNISVTTNQTAGSHRLHRKANGSRWFRTVTY